MSFWQTLSLNITPYVSEIAGKLVNGLNLLSGGQTLILNEGVNFYSDHGLIKFCIQNHYWIGDQSYFDKGLIIDMETIKQP